MPVSIGIATSIAGAAVVSMSIVGGAQTEDHRGRAFAASLKATS